MSIPFHFASFVVSGEFMDDGVSDRPHRQSFCVAAHCFNSTLTW